MKKQIVSVIGLGYVGLPTACVIANCKNKKSQNLFKVNGIDINLDELKTNILESKFFSKILSEDKNLNKILSQVVRNNKINFSWDAPDSWIKTKGNNFALAVYNFTAFGENVKISITEFPGLAGGIKDNVNRWRKQLGLPSQTIDQINDESILHSNAMGEFSMHKIINIKNPNLAFLSAILPLKQSTVFVKLESSKEGLNRLEHIFLNFCSSFEYIK